MNDDYPSPERLRELLDYEPDTGTLRWKPRTVKDFKNSAAQSAKHSCAIWNGRYAGSVISCKRGQGYIGLNVCGFPLYAHRVAYAIYHGKWPDCHIDHIDGIRTNNRIWNLRDVSHDINMQNQRRATIDSHTGILGVCWDKSKGKFKAQIGIGDKTIYLGYFIDAERAHAAYLTAKRDMHIGGTI